MARPEACNLLLKGGQLRPQDLTTASQPTKLLLQGCQTGPQLMGLTPGYFQCVLGLAQRQLLLHQPGLYLLPEHMQGLSHVLNGSLGINIYPLQGVLWRPF